ncbi:hypothetical protein TKK_0012997 [Trichogramma kaykai]
MATHNFIQPDSLPTLTKVHKINVTADLAVKQQEMRVPGIATIQITLQNQKFELDGWLREERAVVDLYQDVVHLGKKFCCTIPLIPQQGSTPKLNSHIDLENGFPKECQKEVRTTLESHLHILTPTPGKGWDMAFCIDYRRLNSLTEDSSKPIPLISDTLKEL